MVSIIDVLIIKAVDDDALWSGEVNPFFTQPVAASMVTIIKYISSTSESRRLPHEQQHKSARSLGRFRRNLIDFMSLNQTPVSDGGRKGRAGGSEEKWINGQFNRHQMLASFCCHNGDAG